MNVFPGWEQPHTNEELASEPEELGVFARIEGLIGQEAALLEIPARERTAEQRERLATITHELDDVWEKLRERAEHLRRRATGKSA
jgi:hypothetical protein